MLPLILAVALAAPIDPDAMTARQQLTDQLDLFNTEIAKFRANIENGFPEHVNNPQTGMVVISGEKPDANGLHPAMVVAVYTDEPAYRAGIKPGDRILAIGPRVIEHETSFVIWLLLTGKTGPVSIRFERGAQEETVVVERKPLACLPGMVAAFNAQPWLTTISMLEKQAHERIRDKLQVNPSDPQAIRALQDNLNELLTLLAAVQERVAEDLKEATLGYCHAQYR